MTTENKANAKSRAPNQASGNLARVRRYRALHRRVDYIPSPAALAIIAAWLDAKLDNCLAGVLDRLVLAGHDAISGNAKK